MSLLTGKTVVVSGVGAGLGRQVAAAVVRDGGNAVLGARTEAHLVKTAAELDPDGAQTAYLATDITDEGQCRALAALACERFGQIVPRFSTYDSRHAASHTAAFARGINSIQLVNDGPRWWLMNIMWDAERPGLTLPAEYLKSE